MKYILPILVILVILAALPATKALSRVGMNEILQCMKSCLPSNLKSLDKEARTKAANGCMQECTEELLSNYCFTPNSNLNFQAKSKCNSKCDIEGIKCLHLADDFFATEECLNRYEECTKACE